MSSQNSVINYKLHTGFKPRHKPSVKFCNAEYPSWIFYVYISNDWCYGYAVNKKDGVADYVLFRRESQWWAIGTKEVSPVSITFTERLDNVCKQYKSIG